MRCKKVLAIFLAAALAVSSLLTVCADDTAEKIFKVEAMAEAVSSPVSSSPLILRAGEKVKVKLSVGQNTGITSLKLYIDYDEEILEPEDFKSLNLFTESDIFINKTSASGNSYFYFYSDSSDKANEGKDISVATGDFAEVVFNVKEDALCADDLSLSVEPFGKNPNNCVVKNGTALDRVPLEYESNSFSVHNINEGTVVEPTCTEDGYTVYKCASCESEVKGNITPALGHKYEDTVTAPTCTEKGYTTHTCSACGDSYDDSFVDALGHTFGETVTVLPEYNKEGYSEHTCTACGYTEKFDIVPGLTYLVGDANGDGVVDANDAILVAEVCVGKSEFTGDNILDRTDVNGDGGATIHDALLIARFVSGVIDEFPVK